MRPRVSRRWGFPALALVAALSGAACRSGGVGAGRDEDLASGTGGSPDSTGVSEPTQDVGGRTGGSSQGGTGGTMGPERSGKAFGGGPDVRGGPTSSAGPEKRPARERGTGGAGLGVGRDAGIAPDAPPLPRQPSSGAGGPPRPQIPGGTRMP